MSLQLLPIEDHDFDEIISHGSLYALGDDLVGQPAPLCWPVTDQKDGIARLAFHFAKQRARFHRDPTVRWMKVIDTSSTGEIISIARWHFYPNGYDFDSQIHWETYDLSGDQKPPPGFDIDLYNYILTTRDADRISWQSANSPCWILTHLVTRPSQRGKGAAGLLIKWGIEQANKDTVPAYLEAGVMGKPIYERYGFTQVGDLLEVDLRKHGRDMMFVMARMGCFPRKMEEGEKLL